MGSALRVAVATGSGAAGSYSKMVFTGWDYGCQGDRATKLKQKSIHYQLQVGALPLTAWSLKMHSSFLPSNFSV